MSQFFFLAQNIRVTGKNNSADHLSKGFHTYYLNNSQWGRQACCYLCPLYRWGDLSPSEYPGLVSSIVRTTVQFVQNESKYSSYFSHTMPFLFNFLKNRYETFSCPKTVYLLQSCQPPTQDNAPYRSVLQAASEHLANGRIAPHGSWKPVSETFTKVLT